jgi:hypothetical protein
MLVEQHDLMVPGVSQGEAAFAPRQQLDLAGEGKVACGGLERRDGR